MSQMFYSLVGMSVLSAFRLELNKALDIGWRLLGIADHEHDPNMQLQAHGSVANILWLAGDLRGSLEHAEKGLLLFANDQPLRFGNEHLRAACLNFASWCTAALGYPDKGLRRALEFLAWARERGQLLPLAMALNCLAAILVWRGEAVEALKHADAMLALTFEHGFTNWYFYGQIIHGEAQALSGKAGEAIAEIKAAIASCQAAGAVIPGWAYGSLVEAYLAAQQPAEGLSVVTEALELAERTGNAEAKPLLHQLHGELLMMRDSSKEAEAAFRTAIEIAQKQAARFPEVRATLRLARLLVRQGRRDAARAMLAESYNWFNEGFDTADLKDAKALLLELNG
jgi:tetratricopeptide (TPR) repeat protein